ncbi:MAG: tRNA (adenosine(37)-N6)-threonylcarbamoyltransferase complex dimerization subunit type 1 TsaB [Steroidobacteraceae bacterium]
MKLLAVECATEQLSVALLIDAQVRERMQLARGPAHGEAMLPLVAELLAEAQLGLAALDAIAVGRGPGAFTGVRLAISVAQGLAYSVGLPVIPVSTLAAVAWHAVERVPEAAGVLVCQDARMAEVYTCAYAIEASGLRALTEERLCAPQAAQWPAAAVDAAALWLGAGSGFAAYPTLPPAPGSGVRILADTPPGAAQVARLARRYGLAAALAPEQLQPVYLRDSVAHPAAVNKP